MDNDIEIIARVRGGDKQAFGLLVTKYQYRVQNLVGRFVRDPGEREDVTQEVFIKAWRALHHFRGDSAFYTWLYRIATNTAKNHLLSASRRPPTSDVDIDDAMQTQFVEGLVETDTPETLLESRHLVEVIKTALEALPFELRRALVLREFDGMSYEDISVAMNCPIGTVRSRIFRAREAIEAAMKDAGD